MDNQHSAACEVGYAAVNAAVAELCHQLAVKGDMSGREIRAITSTVGNAKERWTIQVSARLEKL